MIHYQTVVPANFTKAQQSFTTDEWSKRGTHRLNTDHILIKYSSVRIVIVKGTEIVGVYNRYTYGGRACIMPKFKGQYTTEIVKDAIPKTTKPPTTSPQNIRRSETGGTVSDQPGSGGEASGQDTSGTLF